MPFGRQAEAMHILESPFSRRARITDTFDTTDGALKEL
jgi:hypothetical protein